MGGGYVCVSYLHYPPSPPPLPHPPPPCYGRLYYLPFLPPPLSFYRQARGGSIYALLTPSSVQITQWPREDCPTGASAFAWLLDGAKSLRASTYAFDLPGRLCTSYVGVRLHAIAASPVWRAFRRLRAPGRWPSVHTNSTFRRGVRGWCGSTPLPQPTSARRGRGGRCA